MTGMQLAGRNDTSEAAGLLSRTCTPVALRNVLCQSLTVTTAYLSGNARMVCTGQPQNRPASHAIVPTASKGSVVNIPALGVSLVRQKHMELYLAMISCKVTKRAWPICSLPVTFGGGLHVISDTSSSGYALGHHATQLSRRQQSYMLMTKGSPVAASLGAKCPPSSHLPNATYQVHQDHRKSGA